MYSKTRTDDAQLIVADMVAHGLAMANHRAHSTIGIDDADYDRWLGVAFDAGSVAAALAFSALASRTVTIKQARRSERLQRRQESRRRA